MASTWKRYVHQDHLSNRVITDEAGAPVYQQGHFPFGELWYQAGGNTPWKFTSYERDDASGLDYALFRFHSPRLGRFMTPDPLAGKRLNPQTLNRYAYALNDPVNLIDPLGLLSCFLDGAWTPCEFLFRMSSTSIQRIEFTGPGDPGMFSAAPPGIFLTVDRETGQVMAYRTQYGVVTTTVERTDPFTGRITTETTTSITAFVETLPMDEARMMFTFGEVYTASGAFADGRFIAAFYLGSAALGATADFAAAGATKEGIRDTVYGAEALSPGIFTQLADILTGLLGRRPGTRLGTIGLGLRKSYDCYVTECWEDIDVPD